MVRASSDGRVIDDAAFVVQTGLLMHVGRNGKSTRAGAAVCRDEAIVHDIKVLAHAPDVRDHKLLLRAGVRRIIHGPSETDDEIGLMKDGYLGMKVTWK